MPCLGSHFTPLHSNSLRRKCTVHLQYRSGHPPCQPVAGGTESNRLCSHEYMHGAVGLILTVLLRRNSLSTPPHEQPRTARSFAFKQAVRPSTYLSNISLSLSPALVSNHSFF